MADSDRLRQSDDWEYELRPVTENQSAVTLNLPSRVVKRADGVVCNEHGTPLFQMFCIAKPASRWNVQPLRTLEAEIPKQPPR